MTKNLDRKRKAILKAMGEVVTLRQGSLTEQYISRPDGSGKKRRLGPYYIHTWYEDGRKRCDHIPRSEAPALEAEIRNYQKMKDLFDELLDVIEQQTINRNASTPARRRPTTRLKKGGGTTKKRR